MKSIFNITPLSEEIIAQSHACPFSDVELVQEILCEADRRQDFIANNMYCRWYWAVARVLQPQSIGEIGVRLGYSLLSLIKGSEHKPQIYGWDNESYIAGSLKVTREGLHAYGIEDVAFQRADSQQLNDLGIASRLDLFSVDGNHTQTGALHDLHLALPTLKSGGYILLDDVTYVHDVCKAAWQFVEEMRLEYHFLPTMRGALLMQKNKSI